MDGTIVKHGRNCQGRLVAAQPYGMGRQVDDDARQKRGI
jgi:hypothetical protein